MSEVLKVGVLGTGKMGGAIIRGIINFTPFEVTCFDTRKDALEEFQELDRVKVAAHAQELSQVCHVTVLAVKPGDVKEALESLSPHPEHPVISVAAGVTLSTIKEAAGVSFACRVMPNLAVEVGAGVTGCFGDERAVELARKIFEPLGYFFTVKNEKLLNAVTGLGGSGPAFVALVIEALSDAGVLVGIPREDALNIALQVVKGTVNLLSEKQVHPAIFQEMVSSPGGTTIAGLYVLEGFGLKKALMKAVKKATKRAEELSGGK